MNIALVYDLRSEYLALGYSTEAVAEFDSDETVDRLAAAIEAHGYRVDRVGSGRALARRLAAGARFDLVFSIAEGVHGRSREAQVPALCELYDVPYVFSDPLTMAVTLDKGVAKRIVRDAGVATAPFAVIEPGEQLPVLDFPYPVFAKPLAEGTGKGCEVDSICHTSDELAATVRDLRARYRQAVIIEPYLSGREFTVGILGSGAHSRVIGTVEVVLNADADEGVYSYRNKELCESLVTYQRADDTVATASAACALDAYKALNCRDAGRVDIRCDADNKPYFLEINPIAGLHPEHSDLPIIATLHGHDFNWLIGEILASAEQRLGLTRPASAASATRSRPFVPVMHAAVAGRVDEADTEAAAHAVCAALRRVGFDSEVGRFAAADTVPDFLAARTPHAVFNLVEAIDGRSSAAVIAPACLERWRLPFTGNDFQACMTVASKLTTKGVLGAFGIRVPRVVNATETKRSRVIVKPVWEHASLGINAQSVVWSDEAGALIGQRELEFCGEFFAEQFIDGREFNVSMLGARHAPEVLPIQETLFVNWDPAQARVVDYEAKWMTDSHAYRGTPRRFGIETAEAELARRLREQALAIWSWLGLGGYARIDFRVDDALDIYVVDVNANPGLGDDAGFVAAAIQSGRDFDTLIYDLVAAAVGSPVRAAA